MGYRASLHLELCSELIHQQTSTCSATQGNEVLSFLADFVFFNDLMLLAQLTSLLALQSFPSCSKVFALGAPSVCISRLVSANLPKCPLVNNSF